MAERIAEPPPELEEAYSHESLGNALLQEYGNHQVLDEGSSDCLHGRVFYINNAFDGQAFWCDVCPRHERLAYSPGEIIRFPPFSLVSTPNPDLGDKFFYSSKANAEGKVEKMWPAERWVPRSTKF